MAEIALGQFACDACEKTYRWTPQLAGKRVKCKCGTVLRVPETEPGVEAMADEPFSEVAAASEAPAPDRVPPAPPPAPDGRSAGVAAPGARAAVEKKKMSEQWWYAVGMGLVMIPVAIYEYSRLGDLESGRGPTSIRVTSLESLLYDTLGRVGVLAGMLLIGGFLIGFGAWQFAKQRRGRA